MKKEVQVSFDSVIMPVEKKETIVAAISQLENHNKIFIEWGFDEVFEKGTAVSMIFYGIPGTGKTLMAEAVSGKLKQKLLTVGPAEIETNVPGGAERNIKRYFQIALGKVGAPTGETNERTGQPVMGKAEKHVLLLDECDSLIADRGKVGMIIAGQINTLLTELEKFTGVIIFTTNRLGSLDPALERRITAKVEFGFPSKELREKIWERMFPKKAPLAKDVSAKKLAEFPLTGGNIKNVVLNSARYAAYKKLDEITFDCILEAIEKEIEGVANFDAAISTFNRGSRGNKMIKGIDKGESSNLEIDSGIGKDVTKEKEYVAKQYKHAK